MHVRYRHRGWVPCAEWPINLPFGARELAHTESALAAAPLRDLRVGNEHSERLLMVSTLSRMTVANVWPPNGHP